MAQSQEPTLIAIMGPTGSGKTTFINLISKSNLEVGNGLESCTDEVGFATECEIFGKKVQLIDTPGFDDTEKTQADILQEIAGYLKASYEDGRLLTGIVYMHRISDRRMGGIARESFRLFRKTCGDRTMKNVVIATNMWGDVTQQQGEDRERELATKGLFFKDALDHGARMLRHLNTIESAHAIIGELMGNTPEVLKMQHELVDEHKGVADTEAGRTLQSELERQEQRHKKEIEALQNEIKRLLQELQTNSQTHQQEMNDLRYAHDRLNEKVARIEAAKETLQRPPPPPPRRSSWLDKLEQERRQKEAELQEEIKGLKDHLDEDSVAREQQMRELEAELEKLKDDLKSLKQQKDKLEAKLKKELLQHYVVYAKM
ncbi:hypothetical protein A0H81_13751 [Grifola frondosa]|uniref:G domain-containing protein n=1 Tax=Grifola frondosa TaxID=5627 RepID=A0A1C7LMZ6_GRIFR|nr:hypothetical protein A0H81_13751 [Grifola frondosa]